jgi:hypothetical protein
MSKDSDFILISLEEEIACPADRAHRFRLRESLSEAIVQRRQRDLIEERARHTEKIRTTIEADLSKNYEQQLIGLKAQMQRSRDEATERAQIRERLFEERSKQQGELIHNLADQIAQRSREGVELQAKVAYLQAEKEAAVAQAVAEAKESLRREIAGQADQSARERWQGELDALRLKQVELEKQRDDARQAAEDLQRRMKQGSQELQGEALELVLERELKTRFPNDEVVGIAKGMHGADVLQRVLAPEGRICGSITWETKNAQNWNSRWLEKVRKDMIAAKSEFGVLVATVLPESVRHFEQIDGIWVCDLTALPGLATVLRHQVTSLAFARTSAEGRDQKMNVLYQYLTGPEFRERVNAVLQTFVQMQAGLEREKRAISSQWNTREKQIDGVLSSLSGMYGDLQGIIGANSLPTIPVLDLDRNPELDLRAGT